MNTGKIGASKAPKAPAPTPRRSGIFGLISEVSTLKQQLRTADEAIQLTDRLAQASQSILTPLTHFVRNSLQASDLGIVSLESTDLDVLKKQKARLDTRYSSSHK